MKIGMIAMSGLRVCDEELLNMGLTLPGFMERSVAIAALPSLGLLTLAGMTPKEHSVEYHDVADLKDLDALPGPYDLVAISSMTAQMKDAYALAKRFRETGAPVVIGGLHATALPDDVAPHVDAVIIGEGESVWLEILDDVKAGTLKERYDARDRPFDFKQTPMPAFELLDFNKYNRITIQTSRGCPLKCSFCASSILLVPNYKQKPIERVLAEVDRVIEYWPRPFIEFADDNTFVNKKYWKRLLPELAKRKIRWFTETDISVADDDEMLTLLRQAGCKQVLIGLESATSKGMNKLDRNDWKLRRNKDALEKVRKIQSYGVRVNGCFIVGLDGHDEQVFNDIYNFADEADLFDVQITYPTPFPGTPMRQQWLDEGRITHIDDWERYTLFDINFVPKLMTQKALRDGFLDLTDRLYRDAFNDKRRKAFRHNVRNHLRVLR